MEGGRMAKAIPGVGRSRGKESVEEGGKERERPIFLGVHGKTNKALSQDLYRSRRRRVSSRGGVESLGRKVSLAGFCALKRWRTRRNLNLPGFGRVRELMNTRFRRVRPALYRNRSPLMRREGAAVRSVSCCTNPRKEWIYTGIYVEIYCFKGACPSPRLFGVVIS